MQVTFHISEYGMQQHCSFRNPLCSLLLVFDFLLCNELVSNKVSRITPQEEQELPSVTRFLLVDLVVNKHQTMGKQVPHFLLDMVMLPHEPFGSPPISTL